MGMRHDLGASEPNPVARESMRHDLGTREPMWHDSGDWSACENLPMSQRLESAPCRKRYGRRSMRSIVASFVVVVAVVSTAAVIAAADVTIAAAACFAAACNTCCCSCRCGDCCFCCCWVLDLSGGCSDLQSANGGRQATIRRQSTK